MKHWIWDGYSPGGAYAFAESVGGLPDAAQEAVLFGRPLDEPLPAMRVTALSPGALPDTLATVVDVLLVSDTLRAVLREHVPDGVQHLPARVPGADGEYWGVNATARVAALDREKSELENYPGTEAVRRVRRLVLRPIPADAPALFHLEEIPQLLLVSDALRKALQAASKSAGEFQAPEEWKLGFFDDEE
jgi:hypothetical protein